MAQDITDIKELIKTLVYLEKIVPTEKSIQKLDKNTLYEIVFAHIKLETVLENGIEDSLVESEVKDLHSRLGVMIELIPEETVNEALKSDKYKSMRQVDKLKYSTGAGFDGMVEKSYRMDNSPMKTYILARAPSYAIMTLLALIIASGGMKGAVDNVALKVVKSLGGDINRIPKGMSEVSDIISIVVVVLAMILVMAYFLSIMIDILYISMPMVRRIIGGSITRLVSDDAKNVDNTEFNESVQFIKVKEPDRIARNLRMYKTLKEKHPKDARVALIAGDIEKGKGKKYLYALAKVEYLYDKLEC